MAVYVNEETVFRYIIKTGRPDPCPSWSRWEAVWGPNFQKIHIISYFIIKNTSV